MAEEWDGTNWFVDNPISGLAKATASQLFAVSCVGTCAAVGTWTGAQGGNHAYAVTK